MSAELPEAFLKVATSIGDRICRDAVWSDNYCYWIDDAMEFEGSDWSIVSSPVTADIYSGASGIALFLARLYTLSPTKIYSETAEGAMEYALSRLEGLGADANNGLYGGWAGIPYTLAELAHVSGNARFNDEALRIVHDRRADDPSLHGLDIIFGSAG